MSTLMKSRKSSMRWMALLGLALLIVPAMAPEASAGDYRGGYRGGYGGGYRSYSRGYGGYAPRAYGYGGYNRGYGGYNRGYGGYAPRAYGYGGYNRGYSSFYNYGVPYGGYRAPFFGPGFSLSIGGYPY